MEGDYSTVIGIFERQYLNNEPLTVVEPGTQSRDFTHINDIVSGLIKVFSKELSYEWHLRSGKNVTILDVVNLFETDYIMVPSRKGERFTSHEFQSDTEILLDWKPTHTLEDWIENIKNNK
jgi:UDP-glucose 4-epimerase